MRIHQALVSGAATVATALSLLAAAPTAHAMAVTTVHARAERTFVAAPTPPGLPPLVNGSGPICWFGACYDYVAGRQRTDTAGATVRMLQASPTLTSGDTNAHSLQELALQSADQKSTVEIGWTVDLGLNGDLLPHLFVYHWVDGAVSCYNGCGFVQVSRTAKAGMALRPGEAAEFSIRNIAGDWWVFYDEHAVGYFPGSLWGGGYTRAQVITAFSEVAHATGSTCEQMGDGRFGTADGSGWIADYRLLDATDRPQLTVAATSPALYDAGRVTRTSFHLGGPGTGPC
ncbi:neprosin family prolyl endopeptidase [Streptacidiphilus anmyonensis]|uniref:neprosin family prolyl endopeptidase n=1 Tax=Streptacidiphilus anmyonensis TaxID=405782 RepID=UPI0005AB428B|nr:neprosin family prolyl endopeptidase [Streptacidiphilus anmyonensis]